MDESKLILQMKETLTDIEIILKNPQKIKKLLKKQQSQVLTGSNLPFEDFIKNFLK